MAAEAEPEAKRPCSAAVRLYPLKGVANLRERYTKDTSDVFFVGGETKERLPAHREVLKVASPVFFRMFSGNWKEEREKKIPAPEEYKWGSFKAAIALLYGEEVEVEESSIPDVYRVAHCYNLTGVISTLAQEVCQWGSSLLDTVVRLCALAGGFPDRNDDLLSAVAKFIARHLEESSPSDVACLPYEAMKMLVQSEAITCAELVLLRTLNQWTNEQDDITLRQMKQLYSHICFGTIPYQGLVECSEIGHEHLKSALKNHQQLLVDCVSSNLVQITPRLGQKEVFQVYPMAKGVRAVVQPNRQIEVANVYSDPSVGIVYSGKQEIRFKMDLTTKARSLQCSLCSLRSHLASKRQEESILQDTLSLSCPRQHATGLYYDNQATTTLELRKCTVVLNQTGAHIMLQSAALPGGRACATMEMNLPCTAEFPWLLSFGVSDLTSNDPHFIIHPPTL